MDKDMIDLHILYINLDKRPDRNRHVKEQLSLHGLEAVRIPACEGNPGIPTDIIDGHVGCVLSHIQCVRLADMNKWDSVMILEDDVVFHQDFNYLFSQYMAEVPEDWDMIYLGGNHWGRDLSMKHNPPLTRVTDNVYRTTHTLTTHAYIIKNTMYNEVMWLFKSMSKEVDVMYVTLQGKYNVYTFRPSIAWQKADRSDINNKECDYSFIKEW